MITLYKGDDTGGQLGKNVKIMFHCDDAVDMDDVVVKFDLLGIVKREFTDVHDGDVLDIFISHAESRKFPLGVIFAKMWGEDASGKLRTFANRIPFRVTLNLIAVYGSDGTDSQDIHVYSSVDWDSIANKPTVFPSSVGEVEGLQEALDEINEKIPFDASADNQLADKEWVDQEIDRVAAYYITYDAAGAAFPTRADLLNAETYYSGGVARVPTRNDYAVVLADETHGGVGWRYIYAVADGQTTGQWEAQYQIDTNDYDALANKPSINNVTLTGNKTAAQLDLATTADATLTERGDPSTPGFSAWTIDGFPSGWTYSQPAYNENEEFPSQSYWAIALTSPEGDTYNETANVADPNAVELNFGSGPGMSEMIATRTALPGYVLGPDEQTNPNHDKPLASEAEAEALRTGKQDALSAQQLANIAAVSDALAFDATHSYAAGDPVVYNGTLYTFTAAHTGAWTGSDVSEVDIIARLAGKLDASSAAPTFAAKTYAANDLCTYNGVVYRCKVGYTATASSAKPDADTTHWEAKPVSDLFLPLTGGTMTGAIQLGANYLRNSQGQLDQYIGPGYVYINTDGDSSHSPEFQIFLPKKSGTFALAAANPTSGNLAALDASGNPTDAGWTAGDLARYSLVAKTIDNGAVTLDDRAMNAVAVSSALASLTVNFPTATSGKARDFGLRLSVASGITTAPELVLPQGITFENADGEVPEIGADGAATILYFTETAAGVFLVKGEVVTAIS